MAIEQARRASALAATRERVVAEQYVYMPMRDGVQLAADVYRPSRPGIYPALLTRTPYDKNDPVMIAHLRAIASHGYAVVINEMRGTNASQGTYDWYNYVHGPMDGYDAVEWVARQPWCNGDVGMFGGSAYGVACWTAAVQRPPHLKALFLTTGAPTDAYRDQWYIGGVYQLQNRVGWAHMMMPRLALPELPPPDAPGGEMRRRVYNERMAEMQRRAGEGKGLLNLDWFDETLQHPTDGPFWQGKSTYQQLGNVDVPAYLLDNWDLHFVTGTLRAYQTITTPKKLTLFPRIMTPPPWGIARDEPPIDFEALMVQWFDYWLKGIDNGVMDEPPVLLYVQGENTWREEHEWPLARTEYQRFYFHAGPSGSVASLNDGSLDTHAPTAQAKSSALVHDPANPVLTPPRASDLRPLEARSLTFTSAPMERDLEVTGPITVVLYAASTASDADFIVHLTDVGPDGRSRHLNVGALKASHRDSHATPAALVPGEVYCLSVEVWPTSNVFKAGHRLRISVSGSDFPFFAVNPLGGETRVFHDAGHPSHAVLPVIPR